jgi:hypothetical protein
MYCETCKIERTFDYFYNNNKTKCKLCIKSVIKNRTAVKIAYAKERQNEQDQILAVIKQFQQNKEPFVYLLSCDNKYKIGFSTNLAKRLKTFNTASPIPYRLVGAAPGDAELEKKLHSKLVEFRTFGEWFMHRKEVLDTFKALDNATIFYTKHHKGR